MARGLILTFVACLALAGCSGSDPAAPAAPAPAVGSGAAAQVLTAASSVDAPVWNVGQWWEWQVSFGSQMRDGTWCSIVVAADGSSYKLATERTAVAKDEAAFDQPLLGTIQKQDLRMDGWGNDPWSLLSFPLSDGKTWTTSMPNIAWDVLGTDTAELAMSASFDTSIGKAGGFHLTGQSGSYTLMQGEYDAAAGWFTGLRFYDVDPGQEGLEIGFHAKSFGQNYTGPYFLHSATPLLALNDGSGLDAPPPEGRPFVQPQPTGTFTATAGTTLYGFIAADTVVAARGVALVDPAGGERHLTSQGDLNGGQALLFIDEPAKAGDWHLVTAGAGGYSYVEARILAITEGNFTL